MPRTITSDDFPASDDFDVLTGPATPPAPLKPRQVRHVHA